MLNMMGLGFSFGGKDQGLLNLQGQVGQGFETIGGKLGNLMEISNKFTASGMNLTTSLEAFRVKSDQTARAMVANAGFTGKAAKKMRQQSVAMAEGLNITADAAARATIAAERNRDVIGALGVDARDLAKFQAVTGASAIELTEAFGRLRGEMGVSDTELKEIEKSLIASGSATRDVGGQIKFLTDATQFLSREFALGSEDIAKYTKGVLEATAGFMPFVRTTNEARDLALKLTENLIQGQENFQGLMAGTRKDIDSFSKELAVSTQDVGEAFDMMSKSPADFVQTLIKMGAVAQDKGLLGTKTIAFLRSRLEQALDPEMAAVLINVMKGGSKAAEAFTNSLKGMPTTIKEINKVGFTTGRTLNEQFLLAQERMVATFRKIGRESARDFVRGARKDFKEFGKDLQEMASDTGPMGSIVNKMSEMHQIGAMALVPKALRPMTSAFATMATQLIPVVDSLGQLGVNMNSVTGIATGTAAALGFVWFRLKQNEAQLRRETKGTIDAAKAKQIHEVAIKKTATEISGFLKETGDKILQFVKDAPLIFRQLEAIYNELDDTFERIWMEIQPPLEKYIGLALNFAKKQLTDAWDGMMASFEGTAVGDEASVARNIGASMGRALDGALEKAFDIAGIILDKLWNRLKNKLWDNVKSLGPSILGAVSPTMSGTFRALEGIRGLIPGGEPSESRTAPQPTQARTVTPPKITGSREEMSRLLDAVNNPDWYYQSYQPMFQQLIGSLVEVTTAAARSGPTAEPTRPGAGNLTGSPYSTRLSTKGNGAPIRR